MSGEKMMKAAVLHQEKDMRVQKIEVPELEEDEVLIKVKANGICGSDVHFYEKGELGPFVVNEPYVPGHESSGEIVEIGDQVKNFDTGDRVVIEPGIPCRRCQFCKTGRYNLCQDVVFMSAPPINGTLSEYVAVPSDFVYELPSVMDYKEGAMVEPTVVGVHACNRGDITGGMSVVVLGVGPIGLLALQSARAYGATRVIAVDMIQDRLELAEKLGATEIINAKNEDLVQKIKDLTEDRGVDVALETAGSVKTSQLSLDLVKRGGTVVHVGWTDPGEFSYSIEKVMEKELDIRGVNRYANAYPTAISLIADNKIKVKPLITHTFELYEAEEAFAFTANNKTEVIKSIIMS